MKTSIINKVLKSAVANNQTIMTGKAVDAVLTYLNNTYGINGSVIVLKEGHSLKLTRLANGSIRFTLLIEAQADIEPITEVTTSTLIKTSELTAREVQAVITSALSIGLITKAQADDYEFQIEDELSAQFEDQEKLRIALVEQVRLANPEVDEIEWLSVEFDNKGKITDYAYAIEGVRYEA